MELLASSGLFNNLAAAMQVSTAQQRQITSDYSKPSGAF
jgi:hypothetical protein